MWLDETVSSQIPSKGKCNLHTAAMYKCPMRVTPKYYTQWLLMKLKKCRRKCKKHYLTTVQVRKHGVKTWTISRQRCSCHMNPDRLTVEAGLVTLMFSLIGMYLLFLVPIASADWIQVSSVNKGPDLKGEIGGEHCYSSTVGKCLPDIHSWTAKTWGTLNNTSRGPQIMTGNPRSSEGKMLLLSAAHDRLMNEIQRRLLSLDGREARGGKGGMGSMESALITISLLTFAVYLIKLVMMLIHALHSKKAGHGAELIASTAQPAGVQTLLLSHGRRRRSLSYVHLLANLNDKDLNYH